MSIALAISAALVTGNIFPVGGAGVGLPVVGYYDFVAKKTEKGYVIRCTSQLQNKHDNK